jgi:pimeloyl-ACP methyl ester carboxylesterase
MHVAEAGEGEPVLLLHGFPQHWWEWRGVLPRLAAHYRVIAPDLRGAGWTAAPAEGYTKEQQQADVLALLDHLGLDRVHLVAHDWSAIVGFGLALDHPERLRQYVSLATPHPWIRFQPAMLAGLWRLWFQPVIATPGLGPRLLGRGDQRLARYLLEQTAAGSAPLSAADLEMFLAPLRQPERARAGSALYRRLILPEVRRISMRAYQNRHLTTPTRVIYGAAEPGVTPDVMGGHEAYADDLSVEAVEGAAHFLVDARPDAVADRILAFFGRS